MSPTRAIIADDEPPLRSQLRLRLADVWPELAIAGEAGNGRDAVELIDTLKPDVAFLDIRMPVLSGLDVAEAIDGACHVVLVTAYDEYAVKAFEAGAVDYLLKPVTADRLTVTLARLKARLASPPALNAASVERLRAQSGEARQLTWIKASTGSTLRIIAVEDVLYFQAEDKYTKVVTREAEAWIRTPLRELTDALDAQRFWQVHRGTIVNVRAIERVDRDQRDLPLIRLLGRNESLPVSRPFAHLFKAM